MIADYDDHDHSNKCCGGGCSDRRTAAVSMLVRRNAVTDED
jgi:hypothetical protein